jgi:acetate kinase
VSKEAAKFVQKPLDNIKIIICHLGNGSSITAVKHGKSIDTSMGFTPMEGLVMGTRSGDIDPGVIFFLQRQFSMSFEQVEDVLNRKSGILGVSGISNDMREVCEQAENGDMRCQLALEIYTYRVKKYIGAYAAIMGGLDVLIFTAGIGENSSKIRAMICEGMEFLGIHLDEISNQRLEPVNRLISTVDSESTVLVIPTCEEKIIVEDTLNIIGYKKT